MFLAKTQPSNCLYTSKPTQDLQSQSTTKRWAYNNKNRKKRTKESACAPFTIGPSPRSSACLVPFLKTRRPWVRIFLRGRAGAHIRHMGQEAEVENTCGA